jgi:ligand-binding SRPBCC domain-containing protein
MDFIFSVPEPPAQPPKFSQILQNITASDGTEVTFSCVVTGQPMPEISWFHNHKCIDKSEDFVITFNRQIGKIDLVIVDCLPDDQGLFKCVARNKAGQAVTECTLTVTTTEKPVHAQPIEAQKIQAQPQAPPPQAPPTQPPPQDIKREDQVIVSMDVDTVDLTTLKEIESKVVKKIVKRISGQPPRFTKPIQPCVVKEQESCTFTAVVVGAPLPEIAWLKDKKEHVLSPRHVTHFDPDTGTCSLTINNAEPGDIGVYSCRATNPAGRATCTANVVVVRKYPMRFF